MSERYQYLRDYSKTNKHPVGCIAVQTNKNTDEIHYAFSVCSPQDKFNSKIARAAAAGRLEKDPIVIKGKVSDVGHEITKLIMQDIINNNNEQVANKSRSYLAFKAAEGWLSLHEKYQSIK